MRYDPIRIACVAGVSTVLLYLLWLITGLTLAYTFVMVAGWAYLIATYSLYLRSRRMRTITGMVIFIIGIGYAVKAFADHTTGTQREQSSLVASVMAAIVCALVGVLLLLGRRKRANRTGT